MRDSDSGPDLLRHMGIELDSDVEREGVDSSEAPTLREAAAENERFLQRERDLAEK